MGYSFTISNGLKPKQDVVVPWPCESDPERTYQLFADDVLTKDKDTGKYMCHTGLGVMNLVLTDEQIEPWGVEKRLQIS